jgi:hypothetical protein
VAGVHKKPIRTVTIDTLHANPFRIWQTRAARFDVIGGVRRFFMMIYGPIGRWERRYVLDTLVPDIQVVSSGSRRQPGIGRSVGIIRSTGTACGNGKTTSLW